MVALFLTRALRGARGHGGAFPFSAPPPSGHPLEQAQAGLPPVQETGPLPTTHPRGHTRSARALPSRPFSRASSSPKNIESWHPLIASVRIIPLRALGPAREIELVAAYRIVRTPLIASCGFSKKSM